MTLDTRRHDALFDKRSCTMPINIIGAGGIGSHVAQMLAKLGVGEYGPVYAWDGDKIEPHNLANQAYDLRDVAEHKVVALQKRFKEWSGAAIQVRAEFIRSHVPLAGVVFLCVDDNDVRKEICERSIWNNPDVQLLIEARMGASYIIVHMLDPNDQKHVETWNIYWHPHAEAENAGGCGTTNSVINTATATASFAVELFKQWSKRKDIEGLTNQVRFNMSTFECVARTWPRTEK